MKNILLFAFGVYGLIGVILAIIFMHNGKYMEYMDELIDSHKKEVPPGWEKVFRNGSYILCILIAVLFWPMSYTISISFDKKDKNDDKKDN